MHIETNRRGRNNRSDKWYDVTRRKKIKKIRHVEWVMIVIFFSKVLPMHNCTAFGAHLWTISHKWIESLTTSNNNIKEALI